MTTPREVPSKVWVELVDYDLPRKDVPLWWCKLPNDFLRNSALFSLDNAQRLLWAGLLCEASERHALVVECDLQLFASLTKSTPQAMWDALKHFEDRELVKLKLQATKKRNPLTPGRAATVPLQNSVGSAAKPKRKRDVPDAKPERKRSGVDAKPKRTRGEREAEPTHDRGESVAAEKRREEKRREERQTPSSSVSGAHAREGETTDDEKRVKVPLPSPDDLVRVWNESRGLMPEAPPLTRDQRELAIERLAECPDLAEWAAAFTRLSRTKWATGRKRGRKGVFRAQLSWVIGDPERRTAILAGSYDDHDAVSDEEPRAPNCSRCDDGGHFPAKSMASGLMCTFRCTCDAGDRWELPHDWGEVETWKATVHEAEWRPAQRRT